MTQTYSYRPSPARLSARQRGMTLIELMVAMLVGLLLTLAMASALTFGESQKRSTSATSDMDQSGAYAASVLDHALRNAGAGLMQATNVIGCNPGFTANHLPQPFHALLGGDAGQLRVAPVLIAQNPSGSNPASDVLMVMSGSGAAGGVTRAVANVNGNQVTLAANTVGISAPSLLLVTPGAVGGRCPVQAVASVSASAPQITLAASPAFSSGAALLPLGSQTAGDVQFQLLGVDTGFSTLESYDLLPTASQPLQPLTSNVAAMQALYGIADSNGRLTQWVPPSGMFAIENLLANPDQLSRIVAIRMALVLKGSLYEKTPVAAAPLTWFNPDLAGTAQTGVEQTLNPATLPGDGSHYRYRVVEFIVPLRNNLLNW